MSSVNLNVHSVDTIHKGEIEKLESGAYSQDLIIAYEDYKGNKTQIRIVLFAKKKEALEIQDYKE